MTDSGNSVPELWLECKEVCRDCPRLPGSRSLKKGCLHPWRHLIIDSIDDETGEVPFATPEEASCLGASVSAHVGEDGKRPSVQLYAERPCTKLGMVVVRVSRD